MKFIAEIKVRIKPEIKDIKGLALKSAVQNILDVKDLDCRVGSFYVLNFEAENLVEAEEKVRIISEEILANPVIENFEVELNEC